MILFAMLIVVLVACCGIAMSEAIGHDSRNEGDE